MHKTTHISLATTYPNAIESIKKECADSFTQFFESFRSYTVSVLGSLPDVVNVGGWVLQSIYDICSIIASYYDAVCATKFYSFLRSFISLLASKIESIQQGESIKDVSQSDLHMINSLTSFMESVNPGCWCAEIVRPILVNIFNLWLNVFMARAAEEWDMEASYVMSLREETAKLADIFSSGIIATHPDTFNIGAEHAI